MEVLSGGVSRMELIEVEAEVSETGGVCRRKKDRGDLPEFIGLQSILACQHSVQEKIS